MPIATGNVSSWGFGPIPAGERLRVGFIPSEAGAAGSTLYPLREVWVEPAADGSLSVELPQTTNMLNDPFLRIRFEWFEQHPILGWRRKGSSNVKGELRIPKVGGRIVDLLSVKPAPGAILHGFGPPPDFLDNAMYVDTSGPRLSLYLPPGGLIS